MVDTADRPPDAAPAPSTTWGDRVRFALRGLGQTLITLGVIVLLFVVYEVYVTNYFAQKDQKKVKQAIEKIITDPAAQDPADDPTLPLPGGQLPKIPDGTGIAILYIPRLGSDYSFAIVEGTNDSDLEKGPGHYAGSALPGQVGNFAVAGHRVGKGEPFLNLDHLQPGDPVIVETKSYWYVYKVKGVPGNIGAKGADGIPGREVVSPSDSNVLLPVPDHPGATPTEKLMTMTTCHPKFTAQNRMIVYAALAQRIKADKNSTALPAAIKAYYSTS